MNQVICTGRLTKDVTVNYTPSQMAVAHFNIALDRGKDKNGESRGADFPSCVAFGKTAENLERFSGKGLRISIVGRIQTGNYEKDGVRYYTTDIVCDRIEFIDWRGQSDAERIANAAPLADQTGVPQGFAAIDEDIPF